MNKPVEYAKKVLFGEIVAPSQVRKACENFLHEYFVLQDDEDYLFFWDDETEELVTDIIYELNFARGPKARQSIGENFSLFQWFFTLNIFCWKYKENPEARRITEAILTLSRKNAKSNVAAIIHIVAMMIDEEDAKHFCAANDKEQAGYVYDEICDILNNSPFARPLFKVMKSYVEYIPSRTKLVALAGTPKDGAMSFVATVDECGRDNNISEMVNAIEGGQLGPTSPLIVKISTSYPIENAYNYWQTVVDGLIENTMNNNATPEKFGLAYNIDNPKGVIELNGEMMERWQDQSTWLESNPLLAENPSLFDKLKRDYEKKKHVPKEFEYFKVKNLNIWLPAKNDSELYFMDLDTLQQFEYQVANSWEWWRGKKHVMIGIDLSLAKDNTSVTFLWCDIHNDEGNGAGKVYVKNKVFYPKSEEAEKVKHERLPYDVWSASEYDYCMPFGQETVDWDGLGPYLHNIIETYNIGVATMLYDRKYAKKISKYFYENVPMTMEPHVVEQNSAHLGPVISELQKVIYDGDFYYAPNKLFEASCTNAEIYYPMGKPYLRKPEHGKHTNKVDSVFSTLNAYKGHMMYVLEDKYTAVDSLIV